MIWAPDPVVLAAGLSPFGECGSGCCLRPDPGGAPEPEKASAVGLRVPRRAGL